MAHTPGKDIYRQLEKKIDSLCEKGSVFDVWVKDRYRYMSAPLVVGISSLHPEDLNFRLFSLRKKSQLRQQGETVRRSPMLDHLSSFETTFVEHGDLKGLAVRRPHEPAAIRPTRRHPYPDLVSRFDHLFDGQVEIRESRSQKLNVALHAFQRRVQPKLMFAEVGPDPLAQYSVVTLIERFRDDFAKRRLILSR